MTSKKERDVASKWIVETSQGHYEGKTPNDAIRRVPPKVKVKEVRRIHHADELLLY